MHSLTSHSEASTFQGRQCGVPRELWRKERRGRFALWRDHAGCSVDGRVLRDVGDQSQGEGGKCLWDSRGQSGSLKQGGGRKSVAEGCGIWKREVQTCLPDVGEEGQEPRSSLVAGGPESNECRKVRTQGSLSCVWSALGCGAAWTASPALPATPGGFHCHHVDPQASSPELLGGRSPCHLLCCGCPRSCSCGT